MSGRDNFGFVYSNDNNGPPRSATMNPYSHGALSPGSPTPLKGKQTHRGEATPTKAVFDLGTDEDQNEGEEEEESDDDEEFESHYSRQSPASTSSSASSEHNNDDEAREAGDIATPLDSHNGDLHITPVHRVASLPASATSTEPHHLPTSNSSVNLHLSRSTTALHAFPPSIPQPLYPPFYNKPRTPLPPSPSLTSLLRPPSILNRSTTSTRPTSPDSSDVETPNDTEAQVAQQARRANPVAPTAPRVPTYEYYGFTLYLASSLAFLMYILWSYLPSPFLHALGITYYPDRWWALAIPAWIVMMLCYIYIALACYNVEYLTLGLRSLETMVDECGSVAILDENGRIRKGGSKRFVADIEERAKREALSHTWDKRRKGVGGSGRSATKKKNEKKGREREKEREDEWFGYTGEIVENGVASGLSWRQIWNEGTDAVMDVPLGGVCEVLYGEGRDLL